MNSTLLDALTGLPNRRGLAEHLAQVQPLPSATLLVDIDHFAFALGSLGHEDSDRILVEIAHMIAAAASPAFVARVAGDEFAVVLPHDQAHLVATSLQRSVREAFVSERQQIRLQAGPAGLIAPPDRALLTVSVGIAHVDASGGGIEQRLNAAGLACAQAKAAGRDCIHDQARPA